MDLTFPLARGSIDPMVDLRSTLKLRDLVAASPDGYVHELHGPVSVYAVYRGNVLVETAEETLKFDEDGCAAHGKNAIPHERMQLSRISARYVKECALPLLAIGRTQDGYFHCALLVDNDTDAYALTKQASTCAQWIHLRTIGHMLSDDEAALSTMAVALAAWHEANPHCVRCGGHTHIAHEGWTRVCPSCEHMEYPRQDPSVIVAVVDEDERILLAHNMNWREKFMSLPAGFVDAGEAPERAVIRELNEEVGLRVDKITYVGSQPWPFPRSLMLGYCAQLHPDSPREPRPDEHEIDRARFFSREELKKAIEQGELEPPAPTSIARVLIEHWFGGELPTPAARQ
ncbi:NAD(+) diphosphatase [Schaalia sp. lx-260]|uniref:NAD(+) diphosphatase n=1 Tax=Schaalia sp. lx-260 TaxID=2899082 RepID=UPI001E3DA578|nr:NAD(+) diphosphatase [Schaalia sp. lx-260]MCD4550276.1 NAD(+) diphosphatase [Schaalia sp. lx-260]